MPFKTDHGSNHYRIIEMHIPSQPTYAEFESALGKLFTHPVALWVLVEDVAGNRRLDSITTRGIERAQGFTSEETNFTRYTSEPASKSK